MLRKYLVILLLLLISSTFSKAQNPEKELYVETMGVLSSQNLYLSYVYLGTATDAYMNKAMEKEFCLNLLNEYVEIMEATKKQMSTFHESANLDEEGKKVVQSQIDIYAFLMEEAHAFLRYLNTDEDYHIEAFEQNRVWAWNALSKLLGIEAAVEEK
jgi:hypothetical protein